MAHSYIKRLDFPLIFSSLILAFCVWVTAKQVETNFETITIPVRIHVNDELCEFRIAPEEMQIKVEYPSRLRSYVTNDCFEVALDVSGAHRSAGIEEFKDIPYSISLDDVVRDSNVPLGIRKVMFVSSNRIQVQAKLHSADIALRLRKTGRPETGYELDGELEPLDVDQFRLVGPPSQLRELINMEGLAVLRCDPIDLSGRREAENLFTNIIVPEGFKLLRKDREQRILTPEEHRILVRVPIIEEVTTIRIEDVPIVLEPFTDTVRFDYTPRTVDYVEIKGFRSLVGRVKLEHLKLASKNPLNENPGFVGEVILEARFTEAAEEEIINNIEFVRIEPASVKLSVSAAQQ